MENITYEKVGEILRQHLQGKADPVYVTTAIPQNTVLQAFSQLFIEYDIKTEQEADLIIYYLLNQLKLYLDSSYDSTLRKMYDLFNVDTETNPELMTYRLLDTIKFYLTEKKLLLIP